MNRAAVLEALPLAAAEWQARQLALAEAAAGGDDPGQWQPQPHQVPPEGDWDVWLLLAGRMSGKTDACAGYMNDHVSGPACLPGLPGGHRPSIIAPTLGDALDACVNGPSGLKAHNPRIVSVQTTGGTYVRWPSGAEAKLFGASSPEDVERLRAGGNRCIAWAEELAAWRQIETCWDHLQFGLRLGPKPRVVASTTPKPRPLLKRLVSSPATAVTRASSRDNRYITPSVLAKLYERYGGTRLGRQELDAELLEDVEGALWQRARLDDDRAGCSPELARVVVAVDPAVTSGPDSDETGIVVAAKGVDGQGYVLADLSCRLSPDGWARRAVTAMETYAADRLVAEVNNGGDLVERLIRTVDRNVPYRAVHASRGKRVRAEPIAALYEQHRVHHVGSWPELEDQMCAYTADGYPGSPDRVDALVYALSDLMLQQRDLWFA